MIAATICSGMGAPETAMPHWNWVLASEIESAPRAVLAQRHGAEDAHRLRNGSGPALWGDFTALRVRHFRRLGIALPEWLVAGTPCQAFSVAGNRGSLADDRGNLTLEFLRLAHSLRRAGALAGFLWENVPGILSMRDNAFGCFLAGIVGADAPLVSPLKRGRWPVSGMVDGPLGRAAWRVQDAKFHGLAQRRERVFVVAGFVDRIDPAAILLERIGLRGNSPPRREAREAVAALTASGVGTCGTDDNQGQAGHLIAGIRHHPLCSVHTGKQGWRCDYDCARDFPQQAWPADVAPTLTAAFGSKLELEDQHIRGGQDCSLPEVAMCLTRGSMQRFDAETETLIPTIGAVFDDDLSHMLRGEGFDASEDGTGRGTPLVPLAFRTSGNCGAWETGDRTDALTTSTDPNSHVVAFDTTQVTSPTNFSNPKPGGPCHLLAAAAHPPAVCFDMRGREGGAQFEGPHDTANIRAASGGSSRSYVAEQWAVRRLLPAEYETLQGFSRGFTAIPYKRRKIAADEAEQCALGGAKVWREGDQWFTNCMADGPRYKMIGNSMAVPVIRWILERVEQCFGTIEEAS